MLFESIVFFFHKINEIYLLRVKKILGAKNKAFFTTVTLVIFSWNNLHYLFSKRLLMIRMSKIWWGPVLIRSGGPTVLCMYLCSMYTSVLCRRTTPPCRKSSLFSNHAHEMSNSLSKILIYSIVNSLEEIGIDEKVIFRLFPIISISQ